MGTTDGLGGHWEGASSVCGELFNDTLNHLPVLASDNHSFWFQAAVAAVGPLVAAVVGSLLIRQFLDSLARNAEERRSQSALRYSLAREMVGAASALYMQTQIQYRANQGIDPDLNRKAIREQLDAQYVRTRIDGTVLETMLDVYFNSDAPRQNWHRVIDCLTVRYYQVSQSDKGPKRAERLKDLYKDNEGAAHTGLTVAELQNPKLVLNGYRDALNKTVIGVLIEPFHTPTTFRLAQQRAGRVVLEAAPATDSESQDKAPASS